MEDSHRCLLCYTHSALEGGDGLLMLKEGAQGDMLFLGDVIN